MLVQTYEIESRNLLPKSQFDFQKLRSITDSLFIFASSIHQVLVHKQHLLTISGDLANAFDITRRTDCKTEIISPFLLIIKKFNLENKIISTINLFQFIKINFHR